MRKNDPAQSVFMIDSVRAAAKALVAEIEATGHDVQTLAFVVFEKDVGTSIMTAGCECEDCIERMLQAVRRQVIDRVGEREASAGGRTQ